MNYLRIQAILKQRHFRLKGMLSRIKPSLRPTDPMVDSGVGYI